MTLLLILLLLLAAAVLCCPLEKVHPGSSRALAIFSLLMTTVLLFGYLWAPRVFTVPATLADLWWDQLNWAWIPRFGIRFHLGIDGLGFLMLALTLGMGLFGLWITPGQIRQRVGLFHCCYLLTIAGVVGVFTALDLFLFFFFWEVMLIPMFLLIAIWGYEDRTRAAIKFFIFTQASSLLMLAAIVALAYLSYLQNGEITFSLQHLAQARLPLHTQYWLMFGFFIAFAVKLPAVPLHPWLPDAHTQAPTAASILLAAVLLKTGAYGLLRFTLPLFPEACSAFAPLALMIGVASIVYGAMAAYAQQDIKRLVAYSSVSHMGFVLIGVFSGNSTATLGAITLMIAHGLSSAALFGMVGKLQQRFHSRNIAEMSGLWATLPRLSAVALVFVMAAIGLPGLGNFVAEFLVLVGSFPSYPWLTTAAVSGVILAAMYGLRLLQRVFFGLPHSNQVTPDMQDLSRRELAVFSCAGLLLLWIGLYPQPLLSQAKEWVEVIHNRTIENPANYTPRRDGDSRLKGSEAGY
ncbi:complex I subunit 4 family protein [Microbulbifer aggregans]|uniref:complex I subunit 4 family protein n=1 Tax=Microbulbifer aggregans TaxID=1769779 RepID=UPI001CFD9CDE|nr:NADH-quinone oxidoreductase subunit M [Microbulbifer aggregans]